jgi:hypothetical protein
VCVCVCVCVTIDACVNITTLHYTTLHHTTLCNQVVTWATAELQNFATLFAKQVIQAQQATESLHRLGMCVCVCMCVCE